MVGDKMPPPRAAAPTERLRPDDYLGAGLALLADGGVPAVTIAGLCARLGVTKGSFYHHFRDGADFRSALLAHWAVTRTDELRGRIEAEPDPLARIELLKREAVGLEHEAERAIRAWAHHDAEAATRQRQVDDEREEALTLAFVELGIDPARAATLARAGLTMLVGSQQLEDHVDRARFTALLDEYQRWVLAAVPAR